MFILKITGMRVISDQIWRQVRNYPFSSPFVEGKFVINPSQQIPLVVFPSESKMDKMSGWKTRNWWATTCCWNLRMTPKLESLATFKCLNQAQRKKTFFKIYWMRIRHTLRATKMWMHFSNNQRCKNDMVCSPLCLFLFRFHLMLPRYYMGALTYDGPLRFRIPNQMPCRNLWTPLLSCLIWIRVWSPKRKLPKKDCTQYVIFNN